MANVVITLKYRSTQQIDVALPEEVPSQFLALSLANALKVPVPKNQMVVLAQDRPGKTLKLSPASTLKDAGVVNGSFLVLDLETIPTGLGAYLLSDSGVKFLLRSFNSVGRQGMKSRLHLEVDLTPLDNERVISRRQAQIELRDNNYILKDLGSRNGTWINGQRLEKDQMKIMKTGDRVEFGPRNKGGVSLLFIWQV
jgi:uncharacterized ubiquitin-like protein YukD